jgi:hypothetical protein
LIVSFLTITLLALPGQAAAQNYRYGVHTYYLSPYLADKSRDLGSGFVRIEIDWDALQPAGRDQWNDAELRSQLSLAATHRLKLYATLMNTPRWAGACQHCMPDDVWDWYEFVRRVIAEARSSYPDLEIAFGIWNEPNLTGALGFFQGTDIDYAVLFQYASLARNAANPDARMGVAELSVGGRTPPLTYLQSVLKNIRPFFGKQDIVTFHWYPGQGSLPDWITAIAAISEGRDIWLTETGNHTCNDTDQRSTLDYVINTFDFGNPSALWKKVFIYYLWDGSTNCSANIVRSDGTDRPAYVDYRNRATGVSIRQRGIALRAANRKFVSAENGGQGQVTAGAVSAGAWETFDLVDLNGGALVDGDRVALQTASGLYLQADRGGPAPLLAVGPAPGGWETFTLVALRPANLPSGPGTPVRSGDAIALRSDGGYFVSADVAGTEELTADRGSIGAWETFELIER